MSKDGSPGKIVVGVDGSEPSIAALREAQRLAVPLAREVHAIAFWDFPPVYEGYVAMGITGFEESAGEVLKQSVEKAFGAALPDNVVSRLERGHPRQGLINASRGAEMLVVGRRGHGGFGGLLLGSVSSACVAHAHCPVLVVHMPEDSKTQEV
ncbi:universal stress protein [Paenarthrobacter sp. NPDC092416]|uniref:universal stress protein n=1 Tax=Paenarthrobacter sp. NPDC092416 TaxID=3364386 RepID=UPI003812B7E2